MRILFIENIRDNLLNLNELQQFFFQTLKIFTYKYFSKNGEKKRKKNLFVSEEFFSFFFLPKKFSKIYGKNKIKVRR